MRPSPPPVRHLRAVRAGFLNATLLLCAAARVGTAQGAPRLATRWTAGVRADSVLPGYPRPQMVRTGWQTLNGRWDYAIRSRNAGRPTSWSGTILVPFALESQLSGVRRPIDAAHTLWYRRAFHAPRPAHGGHLLLHFGASDWETTVWVNGRRVGVHRGGYDPFTFDITRALRSSGRQEIVVSVWDPTDAGQQPRGKQVRTPRSIWYTAVTGLWQTVWLEEVPRVYISSIRIASDIDAGTVGIRVHAEGDHADSRVQVIVFADGRRVTERDGAVGDSLVVPIPGARLWSPDSPFLYDLRIRLSGGGSDSVDSYVGLRRLAVERDSAGVPRLALNHRPLFEYGLLDQGWWPDGLYTAPTDAAMVHDIETARRLGFNLLRKHVKVEPARWYAACDRLGMLVWQDMPSGDNRTPAARAEYAAELHRVVEALANHPSIVMWVPFNEGWGQFDTPKTVAWLEAHDPTRLVDNASGWTDAGVGAVRDIHAYPGPALPAADSVRAMVLGEFGGLGLPLPGHTWADSNSWGYRRFSSLDSLGDAYRALMERLRPLIGLGLSAAVYTQMSDVELEVNGIQTYDRDVVKLPPDARDLHAALTGPPPIVRQILPPSRERPQRWRYVTAAPPDDWMQPDFADSSWSSGDGGFGRAGTPEARIATAWTAPDLWARRSFDVPDRPLGRIALLLHHDEQAEVWLNGTLIGTYPGYTVGYELDPLNDQAMAALHAGSNTIAVHVHNTEGGQYLDVGLVEVGNP
jgi:hypothetical protein